MSSDPASLSPTAPTGASAPTSDSDFSPSRLARFAFWGNLVCQMGIIVTGGVVRLTGSGLGCSTWPQCTPGSFTPVMKHELDIHPLIEFGNRTLAGVLTFFAVLLLVVTIRQLKHKGSGFLHLAIWPLILTIVQAVVGGLSVLADLHPGVVGPHFLLSPVLIAISAVLVYRLYDGSGIRRRLYQRIVYVLYWVLAVLTFTVLVLGTLVTGSGPHSGDAQYPARLPFDPRAMSWLHADVVMVFIGVLIGMVVALYLVHAQRKTLRAAWAVGIVTILQAVIGYVQYFTGLPEVLVGFHLAGSALLAAAVSWLGASLYAWDGSEPRVSTAPSSEHQPTSV
ncbi:COX15/CtaA family protein [Devriesea agamarum]|uniref:COX15/CtaA family protein n=1 Tax=Devriesea agamarum TaxID=472569 RepID=UPI0009FD63A3|nr:COX15/CtaA family protein [Devriesea agamarum]